MNQYRYWAQCDWLKRSQSESHTPTSPDQGSSLPHDQDFRYLSDSSRSAHLVHTSDGFVPGYIHVCFCSFSRIQYVTARMLKFPIF